MQVICWNTNDEERTADNVAVPANTVVFAATAEDVEALLMAATQARITWGGLGQGSLIRRVSSPESVLTEALAGMPITTAHGSWENEGGSIGDLDPRARRVPPDENGSGW